MNAGIVLTDRMKRVGQQVLFADDFRGSTRAEIVASMMITGWLLWDADEFRRASWHRAAKSIGARIRTKHHPVLSAVIIQRVS